jgi:general secretion pathway protein D
MRGDVGRVARHKRVTGTVRGGANLLRMAVSAGALALVAGLSGCSYLDGDACSDIGNMSADAKSTNGCGGGFFSPGSQRASVYNGDDTPRLWTGEAARKGAVIDTSRINQAPGQKVGQPITGYVGTLRVNYDPDSKVLGADVANIAIASNGKADADDKISVKFENATLDYFLKQILGGALRVNYIAPDDIAGSVTLKTEQPVPKGQLIQIVRDILARNGYEMRFINGVYQIGRPEALAAQEATAASGRAGEMQSRIVQIRKGTSQEVVNFVKQLTPSDVSLVATSGGNSVLVRAPANEIDRVTDLVQSMSDGEIGEDKVAIIPLRETAPQKVAAQLTEFYRQRVGPTGLDTVTIVPLDTQQALLVGARDRRMMEGVRQMVAKIDRTAADEQSLRVIPLVNLQAEETVKQLNAIFSGSGGDGEQGGNGQGGGGRQGGSGGQAGGSGRMMPKVPGAGEADGSEDGSGMAAPGFAMQGGMSGGQGRGQAQGGGNGAMSATGSDVFGGGPIKIVADPRNNAVMVYSSYTVFKRLKEVLAGLDVPQAQVVIEATILEVQITDQLQYGVQWYLSGVGLSARSGSGLGPSDDGGGGGRLSVGGSAGLVQADAVLKALQNVTKVKVVSSPYLTVIDGKTARLVIGDQIPFAARSQSSSNNGNVTVTSEIQVKDTGIVLEVTPRINSSNGVMLNINQSVSKPQDNVIEGNTTPVISTREMKSDILVQSGRTVLLGGLIQDRIDKTETGVPVMKNIPVVGNLFKQKTDNTSRVELVALITPRVTRQSAQIENITRLLRGQAHIR